jgi:hypothetical protein
MTGTAFLLTAVDNTTEGATGLPIIAANDSLTILGNGDTIARSTAPGTPAFRLFDVAAGASLALRNLTLQGGLASGAGVSAEGGAVYSQGTLDLDGAIVQDNTAQGGRGGRGGGYGPHGGNGGTGAGGGLYVANGSVSLTGASLLTKISQGGRGGDGNVGAGRQGRGGDGGGGAGGGVYMKAGTLTLRYDTVMTNSAPGGSGGSDSSGGGVGSPGLGVGGGLFIDPAAVACLDAFTPSHVRKNTASSRDRNIHGAWSPC